MPFKSEKQRRYMHWAESKGLIDPKVVKEYEAATPKGAKLPKHAQIQQPPPPQASTMRLPPQAAANLQAPPPPPNQPTAAPMQQPFQQQQQQTMPTTAPLRQPPAMIPPSPVMGKVAAKRKDYGPGGKFIHDRAHRIMREGETKDLYGSKRGKQVAYAIATQQAHRLGKSPKGFRTSQGIRTAKAKFDQPKAEYKKTAAFADEMARILTNT